MSKGKSKGLSRVASCFILVTRLAGDSGRVGRSKRSDEVISGKRWNVGLNRSGFVRTNGFNSLWFRVLMDCKLLKDFRRAWESRTGADFTVLLNNVIGMK